MRRAFLGVVAAVAVLGASGGADPRGVLVEVDAGPRHRHDSPASCPLPPGFEAVRAVRLEPLDGSKVVDAQVIPGDRAVVTWVVRDLPAGARRRYRLKAVEPPTGGPGAACVHDGEGLSLKVQGQPVLRYHDRAVSPPNGLDPVYRRSGQIHPLFTPSGLVVSDDFPPDHAHQHGLFFAWVNTTFGGHQVDFWNQKERTGSVRHAGVVGTAGGPVFGQFTVRLRHEDVSAGGAPVPVLDEVWTVRAYNIADPFVVDFESRQSSAGPKPLVVNAYHYGGMGLRGNRAWFDPDARGDRPPDPEKSGRSDFLTSEGKGRTDGNHTRPRWVDLSGRVGDRFGGVAVLDNPGNFRFPQPVRLHPNKPYFCFAPMVPGSFTIEPGRPFVSRYRLVLHDGRPDPARIERLWQDYAEPPRARVLEGE